MANQTVETSASAEIKANIKNVSISASINNPFFYSNITRRDFIAQPQLIRWRSRYRGQRESFKINSEIKAFTFDVAKLYVAITEINQIRKSGYDRIIYGGSLPGAYYVSKSIYDFDVSMGALSETVDEFGEGTTGNQQENPFSIEGSIQLFARIEAMRSRFRRARTLGD